MTAPLSLTATMKLAKQASKGTAATTGFFCGRYTQSSLASVHQYIEAQGEHHCGVNVRPTLRKSLSRVGGYVVPFGAQGFLYPDTMGAIALGMGFGFSSSASGTNAYVHTGTIADRAAAKWLTAIHSYGEGADLFSLMATDARIEQLVIEANTRGVMATFSGLGIKETAATGSETGTVDNEAMLLPSKGACTINIEGAAFSTSLRGLRFLISNPTDKNEQNLFSLERSDLPSTGIECGFAAQGLDVSYGVYKKLKWGGTSGTTPTVGAVSGDITFEFQSAEVIPSNVLPYKFKITIPRCEFRMGNFQARGRELVRFDLAGLMIDDENSYTNPITMNLINTVASY